jgi:hypothetical protein
VIRLAILYVGYSVRSSYYDDWLDAFLLHDGVSARSLNLFSQSDRRQLPALLATSDLAVILHSGTGDTLDYVLEVTPDLMRRKCPLVVFMGNEFNAPWLPFANRRAWLREVGAEFVATQLLEATGAWLYEGSGARVIGVPHGLNDRIFRTISPRQSRRIDIGTRAFPYPIYVGNQLRNDLIERTREISGKLGLNIDIRTDDRLTRDEWAGFLNRSRFTVATEAGSTNLERDDARAFAIRDFLRERRRGFAINPASSIRGFARHLPWTTRQWILRNLARINVTHEAIEVDREIHGEVIDRFFSGTATTTPSGTCISSRHFDAIGCGTVQLLVEGEYNGILKAGVHYLPLRKDFSNLEDVLRSVADVHFANDIAESARAHVMSHHTLEKRVSSLLKRTMNI